MPGWSGIVTDSHSTMRRYLAVFLPLLPAERARRSNAAPPELPFALVEKVRGAIRLAALDRRALELGLVPGLSLADARARVPELVAIDHDPAADLALLEWLADGCERYTPMAMTDPPQGLVLDITGCAHPFRDGEKGLARDLARRLERLGITARLALASTPDAALALASFAGTEIKELPVAAIRVEAETHLALRRAGLKTIGDLAARPRAPLAARFGERLPELLARLLGERDVRITPRRKLPAIWTEARFAEPLAKSEQALEVIAGLAGEAAGEMARRGVGGRRFEASLFRSDGHVARLPIETGLPARDVSMLLRLFRERIDSLADPLDPGFGYDMIRLAVPVTEPLALEQLELEGGSRDETEVAALIDRLSTRLGRHRVRRFQPYDSHVPERAAFELSVQGGTAHSEWPKPAEGEPPLRPLHLFDPPQPISVMAEVPDGPPRRFQWKRASHRIVRSEGPERIGSEWWRRKEGHIPGQGGLTRDYYRVEDEDGRRFWIFRHGLFGTEETNPDWYLHGLFT
jgi:protein ImuB